ncbi:MAG: DUF5317 domain-containing protein [Actinomycetota bacterium]
MVVLAVVTVPLAGGRLLALSEVDVRWAWALPLALGVQVVVVSVAPDAPAPIPEALHLGSYVLAGAFLAANVRTIPGLWLITLGGGLNVLAIAVNGGTMPASPGALASAGLDVAGAGFANSDVVPGARLSWLGDVFAIPDRWPLSNVFSVGDVVLALGVVVAIHGICGSKIALRRRSHGVAPTP